VGGMRRESEPVAHNQFLFDWVPHKPENFESCRAKDASLPDSPKQLHRSFSSVNDHSTAAVSAF